jgi:hypothetical protein
MHVRAHTHAHTLNNENLEWRTASIIILKYVEQKTLNVVILQETYQN